MLKLIYKVGSKVTQLVALTLSLLHNLCTELCHFKCILTAKYVFTLFENNSKHEKINKNFGCGIFHKLSFKIYFKQNDYRQSFNNIYYIVVYESRPSVSKFFCGSVIKSFGFWLKECVEIFNSMHIVNGTSRKAFKAFKTNETEKNLTALGLASMNNAKSKRCIKQ